MPALNKTNQRGHVDYAHLDNHFHTVLRNRPDLVETWSDLEVVQRWWQLCPTRRDAQGNAAPDPKPIELGRWLDDPKKILELRRRLSDISWFMRLLCQKIGREANREDGVTGKFWPAAPTPRTRPARRSFP